RCPEPGRWSGRAAGWAPGPLPNPSPGRGGASSGLLLLRRHLRRIRLRLLQHAQDVAAPDVGDLLLGVAGLQQALRDPRDLGDIGQALDPATAVPVGADADMVRSCNLEDVQQVLHVVLERGLRGRMAALDRKSTRLNSSHVKISYAVFCLKKK